METANPQNYVVYPPVNQLVQSVSGTNQPHASVSEPSWHLQSPSATSAQTSSMYSVANRPDLDYPSPAPSSASPPYSHHQQSDQYSPHHSLPTLTDNTLDDLGFSQIDASTGPSRSLRSRRRVVVDPGRRASLPSTFQRQEQVSTGSPRHSSAMYPTPPIGTSRPQTPRNDQSGEFQSQRDRVSLSIASATTLQMHSPGYQPMTPTSLLSPFSPYVMYGQPRSASDLHHNQRAASPALSNVSALTSVSSSTPGPGTQTFAPYPAYHSKTGPRKGKQRKQRLTNIDRKDICAHHINFPNARQEDIAAKFGVERSTISKILKCKQKWLSMPEHEGSRVSKHRPSKFPQIEDELLQWLEEKTRTKSPITDNSIREKAKEIAKMLHITEEKFKASSGWIENFKSRQGIRSGVWSGRRLHPPPLLQDERSGESVLSPLNPAFGSHGRSDLEDDMDSEGSDDEGHRGHVQHHDQRLMESPSMHSAWPGHDNGTPSSQVVGHSPSSSHHPHPPTHIEPVVPHQHAPEPDHQVQVQYVEDPPVFYQAPPTIQEPRVPTLQDAEEAINTLITFIDSEGRDLLEDAERQTLTTIKCALFQAASGIPFNRNR